MPRANLQHGTAPERPLVSKILVSDLKGPLLALLDTLERYLTPHVQTETCQRPRAPGADGLNQVVDLHQDVRSSAVVYAPPKVIRVECAHSLDSLPPSSLPISYVFSLVWVVIEAFLPPLRTLEGV